MDFLWRPIAILMLCSFSNLVFAQYHKDPEGVEPRIPENRRPARSLMNQVLMSEIDMPHPGKLFPNCGLRKPKIPGTTNNPEEEINRLKLIVGGRPAKKNSWPWMVLIHQKVDATHLKICGASLISQRYILTAGHCVVDENGRVDPRRFSVFLGVHNKNQIDGTEYPVRQILVHPSYTQRPMKHDIALMELGRLVEVSEKVYPICLPTAELKNKIKKSSPKVTVTGWGKTSEGGKGSELLQEVDLPIVPLEECKAAGFPYLTKEQMCAGTIEGGKDSCQGDSGGPLVYKLKGQSYVQLGVVSTGAGCARPGTPGIYTRVSEYIKWIYDNTDLGN